MSNSKRLGRVVFVRHGESVWNVTDPQRGLITRFTGWADVALTERGLLQARAAGRCLDFYSIKPNAVYTSLLQRSLTTFEEIRKASENPEMYSVPVINSWRMNERHYGALVGLSKDDAGSKFGSDVIEWRRSWDKAPPKMSHRDLKKWNNARWAQPVTIISEPGKQKWIATEKGVTVPETESLQDCAQRVLPLWVYGIAPRVARGETVLIVAHANSIRAMVKHIDADSMSIEDVRNVNIPSAVPLVYEFVSSSTTHVSSRVSRGENGSDSVAIKPAGEPTSLGMRGRYLLTQELIEMNLKVGKDACLDLDNRTADTSPGTWKFFDLVGAGVSLQEIKHYADAGAGQSEPLVITDSKGVILHANQAWSSLYGFDAEEVVGKTQEVLQGPLTDPKVAADLNAKLQSGLPAKASLVNYRKSGAAFINEITIVPIHDLASQSGSPALEAQVKAVEALREQVKDKLVDTAFPGHLRGAAAAGGLAAGEKVAAASPAVAAIQEVPPTYFICAWDKSSIREVN